jgi:trehalose utilization protein
VGSSALPRRGHDFLAKVLNDGAEVSCKTATLEDPEDGLSESRLEDTDVLVWWGLAHARVNDRTVDRVQKRVLDGMGMVVLHSGHYSKSLSGFLALPALSVGARLERKSESGLVSHVTRLRKDCRPISKYLTKRRTASHSVFPHRTNWFLSPGFREATFFVQAAAGTAAMAGSSISGPGTRLSRPTISQKSRLWSGTPSGGRPRTPLGGLTAARMSSSRRRGSDSWRVSKFQVTYSIDQNGAVESAGQKVGFST